MLFSGRLVSHLLRLYALCSGCAVCSFIKVFLSCASLYVLCFSVHVLCLPYYLLPVRTSEYIILIIHHSIHSYVAC
mgnify:FL=1